MPYDFISIKPATDGKHKYVATFKVKKTGKTKTVAFGAKGYKDYITYYKDQGKTVADAKKKAYIARHQVREDYTDSVAKGTLARYILWNKLTFADSLKDYLKIYF